MKQSWTADAYSQVLRDDVGVEFTVRVSKQPVNNALPVKNAGEHSTKSNKKVVKPQITLENRGYMGLEDKEYTQLSEDCSTYKRTLENMVVWSISDISKLKKGRMSFVETYLI
jgi:hypothetical protein